MDETTNDAEQEYLAAAIRDICVTQALDAWEQAGMSGLCTEGRWEIAMDRLRNLDPRELVTEALSARGSPEMPPPANVPR